MTGWIQLHRKMRGWEWYTDINTCHLFIHLLLSANHKAAKYQGQIIKAGELRTGRIKLAAETGLSEQQIRTSLKRLKSTSEITITKYNKYSVISITNWDDYQPKNNKSTSEITSNQPATNQQLTTNNNKKNKKNKEEEREAPSVFKNKILNEEMKKFAEERGVFGNQLETSWQRFLIKKGNAMIESKCSYEKFFSDWQMWILSERVDAAPDNGEKPLVGEELNIQHLGSAAWRRNRNMRLNPEQRRFLNDYEAKNGIVWWESLRQFKAGKSKQQNGSNYYEKTANTST